jgi:glycosyltransferase involved in cell wall biosynthesis
MSETTEPRRTRVLVLHWGRNGGGPRFHAGLTRALAQAGLFQVHASWSRQAENAEQLAQLGLPSLAVDTFSSWTGAALGLVRLARAAWALRRHVRRHEIDVVVVSMEQIWHWAALWLLPRRVRVLFTLHDGAQHPGEESLVRSVCGRLELGRADALVCLSHSVAVTAAERAGDRPVYESVLPADATAADTVRELPAEPAPIVVGFFGRLLTYKGIDLFEEAAVELAARSDRYRFRVVGQGPAEVTPMPGLEVRRGWVSEEDVEAVVAGFDVLLLPYREASQSGVIGLAVAAGVPIVATPVGGLTEQITLSGAGLLADEVTGASVAAAVERLRTDPALYAQLSARALRSAREELSWSRVAADYAAAVTATATAVAPEGV